MQQSWGLLHRACAWPLSYSLSSPMVCAPWANNECGSHAGCLVWFFPFPPPPVLLHLLAVNKKQGLVYALCTEISFYVASEWLAEWTLNDCRELRIPSVFWWVQTSGWLKMGDSSCPCPGGGDKDENKARQKCVKNRSKFLHCHGAFNSICYCLRAQS